MFNTCITVQYSYISFCKKSCYFRLILVICLFLMVIIFLFTCYQAAKRDHRIQTLELELIQLRQQLMQQIQKRRSASNTNNPSAPLLRANVPSKRKILSAINKAASATTQATLTMYGENIVKQNPVQLWKTPSWVLPTKCQPVTQEQDIRLQWLFRNFKPLSR